MKILLLGYSGLAKKKLIPTFLNISLPFSVASKINRKKIYGAYDQFKSYEEGLRNSSADTVYISLPNSEHYRWAKKALNYRYHVIVDKPICETVSQMKGLVQCAKKNKRLLAESTFFNYHKQIDVSIKLSGGLRKINHIHVNFIIPYPKKNSLLMSKRFKGGAFMDMSPYAASVARIFFNEKIISKKIIIKKNNKNLITSFNLLYEYPNGIYSGCFKFGGQYHNELFIYTDKKTIKINRIFAPPHDQRLDLLIKENNKQYYHKTNYSNSFENFLREVQNKIKKNEFYFYFNRMMSDNLFRNNI